MSKIKTLIIDDERLNRELISKLVLKTNSNFTICGNAENIDEAFELINSLLPHLILLDIKMPGGSGFELLQKFKNPEFEVIFITGYDEYAIKAFEYNALDYILKPIDSSKLENSLNRVYKRINLKLSLKQNLSEIINSYNIDYSRINKIPIHINNIVQLINIDTIIYIKSEDGCTVFKTIENEKHISSKQTNNFDFILDNNSNFCKINRSVYINIQFIKKYSKGQTCEITLNDGTSFEVSRRKKTEILDLLNKK